MNSSASLLDLKAFFIEQGITLWRRKWTALIACWIACLIGWSAVLMLPRSYTSSARAFVDVNTLLKPLLKGLAVDTTTAQSTNVLRQTLVSRPNLEQVLHSTGLDTGKDPAQIDGLIRGLANNVRVRAQGKDLFSVSYSSQNPELAKNVVESLLTLFADKAVTANREEMQRAHDFLEDQIKRREQQLREAELRRADFRKTYADYLADPSSGLPRMQALQQGLAQARQAYESAVVTRDSLVEELKTVPQFRSVDSPTIGANGKIIAASPAVRLAQARAELDELEVKYTARHPDVAAARHQVEDLEALVAARDSKAANDGRRQVPNPVYAQIRLKLVEAQTEVPAAQQRLDRAILAFNHMKEMAAQIPDVDAKAKDLDRDYEVMRKNHDELVQRREAAALSQAADEQADRTQFRIVDPPQVPLTPSFPNFPIMFSLVLLIGIGAGVALPIGIELLRATYASASRLRALGLPVIGAVTFVRRPYAQRRMVLGTASAMAILFGLLVIYGLLVASSGALAAAQ